MNAQAIAEELKAKISDTLTKAEAHGVFQRYADAFSMLDFNASTANWEYDHNVGSEVLILKLGRWVGRSMPTPKLIAKVRQKHDRMFQLYLGFSGETSEHDTISGLASALHAIVTSPACILCLKELKNDTAQVENS